MEIELKTYFAYLINTSNSLTIIGNVAFVANSLGFKISQMGQDHFVTRTIVAIDSSTLSRARVRESNDTTQHTVSVPAVVL